MSFKRVILVAALALGALGIGLTAVVLGGLCLACAGLARVALRRGRQSGPPELATPRTGLEMRRERPAATKRENNSLQVSVRHRHRE